MSFKVVKHKTTKYLRYYESSIVDGSVWVKRIQIYITGDIAEAAERIAIMHEKDEHFRWYEPVEDQIAGRHW